MVSKSTAFFSFKYDLCYLSNTQWPRELTVQHIVDVLSSKLRKHPYQFGSTCAANTTQPKREMHPTNSQHSQTETHMEPVTFMKKHAQNNKQE